MEHSKLLRPNKLNSMYSELFVLGSENKGQQGGVASGQDTDSLWSKNRFQKHCCSKVSVWVGRRPGGFRLNKKQVST